MLYRCTYKADENWRSREKLEYLVLTSVQANFLLPRSSRLPFSLPGPKQLNRESEPRLCGIDTFLNWQKVCVSVECLKPIKRTQHGPNIGP